MESHAQSHSNAGATTFKGPLMQQYEFENRLNHLEQEFEHLRVSTPDANKITLLVFSGDLDKALAGLTIAMTAASMDMDVTLFFTFWGINVLKQKRVYSGKNIKEKMIDFMTPTGAGHMGVSKMNMMGMGSLMLQQMMKDRHVVTAAELLDLAKENGVKIVACSMTMQVMGLKEEELTDGIEIGGAATYLTDASHSGCTLFI